MKYLHPGPIYAKLSAATHFRDRRIRPEMDAADFEAFWELVGDLWAYEGTESSLLRKLKLSNDLLEFFHEKPVHMMVTDTSYIWEEAERVNLLAAGGASSLVPLAPQPPAPQPPAAPVPAPQGAQGGSCSHIAGCLVACQIGSRSLVAGRPPDRPWLQSLALSGFFFHVASLHCLKKCHSVFSPVVFLNVYIAHHKHMPFYFSYLPSL